jgi:hypothetical protein
MSKLNFSNISEAYNIPSVGIKETSEKIEELKKKITGSAFSEKNETSNTSYKRIGPPDQVESKFCNQSQEDDLELVIFRLMKNPKFDDIIKNYINFKHPDWVLNSNMYSSKESFGKKINTSTCDEIKNYIIFFVISILLYLFLSLLLK